MSLFPKKKWSIPLRPVLGSNKLN